MRFFSLLHRPGRRSLPPRSRAWPSGRHSHLSGHPLCAACGRSEGLEVHHIRPFHLYPQLELEPSNLLTLCESARKGHLLIGHLGDWRNINPHSVEDAAAHLRIASLHPSTAAVLCGSAPQLVTS